MPSSHLILCRPLLLLPLIPPSIRVLLMSQLFAWGGQSIGVSASASVLPMNTQDWSPLGWTGWISLQSKGLSRVFSNTTVQKHQSIWANCRDNGAWHVAVHKVAKSWTSWLNNNKKFVPFYHIPPIPLPYSLLLVTISLIGKIIWGIKWCFLPLQRIMIAFGRQCQKQSLPDQRKFQYLRRYHLSYNSCKKLPSTH